MMWLKANLVFLGLLLVVSCGRNTEVDRLSEGTSLETIFVKGDPLNLLDGSDNNNRSVLLLSEIENLKEYSLTDISQYTERELVVEKSDTESVESGNEAVEDDSTSSYKSQLYSFKKEGNELVYSSPSSRMEFSFVERFGKLNLVSLQVSDWSFDLKPIHYSMKNTGDAFSILAETSDTESGRVLLAFTFTKKSKAKEIEMTSTIFKYIFGAGVKIPWEQEQALEVNICGVQSSAVERAYKDGLAQWDQALKGRMKIVTKTLYSYPPFNDLNTHCIYTVKNYQTLPGNQFINMASTMISGNLFKGKIIDADIMIWVKENEKFGTSLGDTSSLQSTTAHEFGHLLGLHHQFDKSVQSIMSYDGTDYLTAYDKKAIALLYPLI